MSVTLSEVKRAAKAHRAPLAGESAGYLVLAIADQVLSAPRMVQGTDIQLTEDGGLRVLAGRASSDAEAELALRRALDSLLLVASSGSAALTRAGRRTSPVGLSGLVRELEAALIPVNRSAARRALARIHRETARALTNGLLPEDEVEPALPMAAVAPVGSVVVEAAPLSTSIAVRATEPELEDLASSEESDALTVALEVKSLDDVKHAGQADVASDLEIEIDIDIDIEVEPIVLEAEPDEAPTVMSARVAAIPDLIVAELPPAREPPVDMPIEACTRPEPVVLRKALRSELTEVAPLVASEACPDVSEPSLHTPTLGSWATQLPVLAPEQIAELSAAQAELDQLEESDLVICSAAVEECTELMPEVSPLSPGVAIIASRRSEVSELLQNFQVAADDSNQGLCRAIKELAGLDLTPAPFGALIR